MNLGKTVGDHNSRRASEASVAVGARGGGTRHITCYGNDKSRMESRVGEEELGEKSDTEDGWNPREEIVFIRGSEMSYSLSSFF